QALSGFYDAVVPDLLLPGLDGLSVLRELHEQRPELPVVIVSARSDLPTKLRGFGLGASDYLSKPFSLDELVARVRVHAHRPAARHEDTLVRVGSLTLDLARRQARLGELVADLSDREFRLLYHLAENPGALASREGLPSE